MALDQSPREKWEVASCRVYAEIWQDFQSGDHITAGGTWGGSGIVLILPVEDQRILAQIASIQNRLVGLPFHRHPPGLLHVTLRSFCSQDAGRVDEVCRLVHEVTRASQVFEVWLRCVNSFFRAPFIELHQSGALAALLAALEPSFEQSGLTRLDYGPRGQVYHLTLGRYTQSGDGAELRQVLKALRETDLGRLSVEKVRLVRTTAERPFEMETLADFSLQR